MTNRFKVIASDISFKIRESIDLVVEIDVFRFTKTMGFGLVLIEIEDQGRYEYLDELHLAESDLSMEDLKAIALNWILRNVQLGDTKANVEE